MGSMSDQWGRLLGSDLCDLGKGVPHLRIGGTATADRGGATSDRAFRLWEGEPQPRKAEMHVNHWPYQRSNSYTTLAPKRGGPHDESV